MGLSGKVHYGGENLLDANLDIDLFARRVQKISVSAKVQKQEIDNGRNITSVIEVNSQGQQLKVDLKSHIVYSNKQFGFGSMLSYLDQHKKPKSVGMLFSVDPMESHLLITSPNKEIIRADVKTQLQKNLQKLDSKITILDKHPIAINMEMHDWNNFKYETYEKGAWNQLFSRVAREILATHVTRRISEIFAFVFAFVDRENQSVYVSFNEPLHICLATVPQIIPIRNSTLTDALFLDNWPKSMPMPSRMERNSICSMCWSTSTKASS